VLELALLMRNFFRKFSQWFLDWLFNRRPQAIPLKWGGYVKRVVVLFITWFLLYQIWILIHIAWWVKFNPTSTAFMQTRLVELRIENPRAELEHYWIDYAKMSNNLKLAVIASEDAKFLQHQGFDWGGIEYAIKKNVKQGKLVAGGSTITQQLAKNLFLSSNRSLFRKFQEVIIAVMLEQVLSKQRIYEIYLNVIEWGNGVFGAEAAARHYYNKGARSISTTQAAKLAAMVPNPRFYDAHRNTTYLNRRIATIKARLPLVKAP